MGFRDYVACNTQTREKDARLNPDALLGGTYYSYYIEAMALQSKRQNRCLFIAAAFPLG